MRVAVQEAYVALKVVRPRTLVLSLICVVVTPIIDQSSIMSLIPSTDL